MTNKGIVTQIVDNKVKLKLFKSSSCSHCSQCSEASKYGKDYEFTIDKKVELGDLITLEISERDVIKAAAIAYIMPPVFMILGYIIANKLNFNELQSAIGSFVGLAISFLILFVYDKFFAKKNIENEIKVISVEKFNPNDISDNLSCEDLV